MSEYHKARNELKNLVGKALTAHAFKGKRPTKDQKDLVETESDRIIDNFEAISRAEVAEAGKVQAFQSQYSRVQLEHFLD